MEGNTANWLEMWGEKQVQYYLSKNRPSHKNVSYLQATRISWLVSFLIGFLLTGALITIEIYYFPSMHDSKENLAGLGIYFLANILLVGLEFYMLFKVGFRCVAFYIYKSTLDLQQGELKLSLSRAILEIPEPGMNRYGLDPYKYRHKSHYVVLILYKLKAFATTFLAKVLVRKLLARSGFRVYSAFVAAPVTGFWDAWVMGVTLREARIRISGRLYVISVLKYLDDRDAITNELKCFMVRLVAVRLVMFGEYNINLDYFITMLDESTNSPIELIEDVSSVEELKNRFSRLNDQEKDIGRRVASILLAFKRKKLSIHEKRLMKDLSISDFSFFQARKSLDEFSIQSIENVNGQMIKEKNLVICDQV